MTSKKEQEISVLEVNQGVLDVCIIGVSPLIYNAMSEKAWHELLMPSGKKNAAERASTLKHEPFVEYRDSTYQNRGPSKTTRLNAPAAWFKKAMAAAALDIPGAAKSQIGRLVWAVGDRVDIYGVPQMMSAITRSADINKTPDVRTRAILPQWACRISFRYMKPILKEQTIANLLGAAGFTNGVGDWRQQKGSASYGQFMLVSQDDPRYLEIVKTGGVEAQEKALANPQFYDDETEKLMTWFTEERKRRGDNVAKPNGKAKTSAGAEA